MAAGWPGVGPQLAERLAKLDIHRPQDLILHLPLRYEDETRLTPIASAREGLPTQLEGEVVSVEVTLRPRRQLVARIRDESGSMVAPTVPTGNSITRIRARRFSGVIA